MPIYFYDSVDTLEIFPTIRRGNRYILVSINDYTRFNQIYLMQSKDQSEGMIISFFTELENKLEMTPAYFHSDRGR